MKLHSRLKKITSFERPKNRTTFSNKNNNQIIGQHYISLWSCGLVCLFFCITIKNSNAEKNSVYQDEPFSGLMKKRFFSEYISITKVTSELDRLIMFGATLTVAFHRACAKNARIRAIYCKNSKSNTF